MPSNPIQIWHRLVRERDVAGLDALLADEVVFYSPVVHTAQVGKDITKTYLAAALHVLSNDSFRYTRELADEHGAVLEFQVELDGIAVNGVDLIRWNDAGKLTEFKVMIRPLKALDLVHRKMAQMLGAR
jgi:SnoaL-like domain